MTKQPSYRFVGYTEPWEEKKFQELSTKKGKKNTNGESYPVYSVSNQSGLIPQSEQFEGSRLDNLDKKSYKIVEPNEFAYNPARINVGSIAFNNLNHRVIVSSLYVIFILDKKVDNSFAIQFIKSDKFIKEVKRNTEGSVREYLFYENFSNIRLPYPPSLPEQTAIGSFFQDIDQLIRLQQRKLEVLKEQKKTYLKLLFPAKGQTKPALRFAGFEDEWKEVKVSDIFRVTRGQVLATTEISEEKTDTYKYPVYSSQTKNEGLLGYYDKYLFETAITWTTDGANAGTVNYREGKFYSTNVNGVLLSDEGFANKVIAEILNNEAWKYVSKVGNPKLMNNVMSEISLVIPNDFREISTLSTFFQDLDKAIAKQEEKVNQLKESKQTLLRKMFIWDTQLLGRVQFIRYQDHKKLH